MDAPALGTPKFIAGAGHAEDDGAKPARQRTASLSEDASSWVLGPWQ